MQAGRISFDKIGVDGTGDLFKGENILKLTSVDAMAELLSRMKATIFLHGLGGAGNQIGAMTLKELASDPSIFRVVNLDLALYNTEPRDISTALINLADNPDKIENPTVYDIIRNMNPELRKRTHIVPVGLNNQEMVAYFQALAVIQNAGEFPEEVIKEANETIDRLADRLIGSGGSMDVGMKYIERSKDFLKAFVREVSKYEFHLPVGSMGGGSGASLFPVITEELYHANPNAIVIASAIMPFADEGSVKFEQFKRASEMTKPYTNLLILHNPQEYVGKSLSVSEFSRELIRKPKDFVRGFAKALTPTKGVRMVIDKGDVKATFGNKGENVGTIIYTDNRAPNGGYYDLIKTAQEKAIPDVKPDNLLLLFEVPGAGIEKEKVTLDRILEATDIIKGGANVKKVIRGVIERPSPDPLINIYVVAIKNIKEKPDVYGTGESKMFDYFEF